MAAERLSRRARGYLAGVTALLVVVALAPPAAAIQGDKISIKIENNNTTKKPYGPMAVNDAGSTFTDDPETCAAVPFCTAVPLEVLLPSNFNPDINEFVLTVRLGWDDGGVSAGGQSAQGNDLDMYIYVIGKDAKGNTTYKEVGRSAGSSQPEVSKLFTPSKTNYVIVVYNFVGVNKGFDLTLTYRDATIRDVGTFETGPSARPGAGGSTADADASGSDFASPPSAPGSASSDSSSLSARPSPNVRPTFSSPSALPFANPSLTTGPAVVAPTGPAGFSGLPIGADTSKDLNSSLAPNESQDIFKPRVPLGPPKPVSGALLIFWFGVVPLVLVGAAAVLMIRRRPAALTVRAQPHPAPG